MTNVWGQSTVHSGGDTLTKGGAKSEGQLTTGWKIMIIAALAIALANSGISSLRNREDDRFDNHEKRIDDLENKTRSLSPAQ